MQPNKEGEKSRKEGKICGKQLPLYDLFHVKKTKQGTPKYGLKNLGCNCWVEFVHYEYFV